jgi:hypothetical protein
MAESLRPAMCERGVRSGSTYHETIDWILPVAAARRGKCAGHSLRDPALGAAHSPFVGYMAAIDSPNSITLLKLIQIPAATEEFMTSIDV